MIACYKCSERHVWYDDDGRAHSCHETCSWYNETYLPKMQSAREKRKVESQANELAANSVLRVMGRHKWNVKGGRR